MNQYKIFQKLKKISLALGTTYSNPLDIDINVVAHNWVGFAKIYLQHPKHDGLALFCGNKMFILEMEGKQKVIG